MYLHTNLMWGSSHGWKREVHWRWAMNRPRPVRGASVCRRGPEINRHGTPLLPWSLVWRPSASQGLRPFLATIILRFTPIQGVNKLTSTKCLLMNFRKLLHMHTLNKILKKLQKIGGLCQVRDAEIHLGKWSPIFKMQMQITV